MPRRVLAVVTSPDPEDELLDRLRSSGSDDDVELMVIAPASDISLLDWIVGDEDAARAEAERRARKTATAAGPATRVIEARVGEFDPLIAIEDALLTFPADELIVVTRPGEFATWLEKDAVRAGLEHFGLPVTHIVDDDVDAPPVRAGKSGWRQAAGAPLDTVGEVARAVARGRSPWVVQLVVLVIVALVAAVVATVAIVLYEGLL
jgi:hypothetical protein